MNEETKQHIARVKELLQEVIREFENRALVHDASKLVEPERGFFEKMIGTLKTMKYPSPEYAEVVNKSPAIRHHWDHNSHHPEYHGYLQCPVCSSTYPKDFEGACSGLSGNCKQLSSTFVLRGDVMKMSLFDQLEMLADWKAAGERHPNGSLRNSLHANAQRFFIPHPMLEVLEKTAKELGWL